MEGMGRLISTVLRLGGGLDLITSHLHGIGARTSALAAARHLSLEDAVGHMLAKYLEIKAKYGWKAIVLGEVPEDELTTAWRAPLESEETLGASDKKNENHHGLLCSKCNVEIILVGNCATCPMCGASVC